MTISWQFSCLFCWFLLHDAYEWGFFVLNIQTSAGSLFPWVFLWKVPPVWWFWCILKASRFPNVNLWDENLHDCCHWHQISNLIYSSGYVQGYSTDAQKRINSFIFTDQLSLICFLSKSENWNRNCQFKFKPLHSFVFPYSSRMWQMNSSILPKFFSNTAFCLQCFCSSKRSSFTFPPSLNGTELPFPPFSLPKLYEHLCIRYKDQD